MHACTKDNKDKTVQGEFKIRSISYQHTLLCCISVFMLKRIKCFLSSQVILQCKHNVRINKCWSAYWLTSRPWQSCLHSAQPAWRALQLEAGWANAPASTGTPGHPASSAQAHRATRWAGRRGRAETKSYSIVYFQHRGWHWLGRSGFSLIIFIRR